MMRFYFLFLTLFTATGAFCQQLAFPGAEGFGRFASGGRGGTVYKVTNLNDAGQGSFRDAVSQPKRTVIFEVAGTIKIGDKIKVAPDITIAGQTAPGDGITIYGNSVSFSGNTIVRFVRFRGSIGMPRGACTVVIDSLDKIVLDHISIEWGRWDNLHIKHSTNVTLQYCLVAESLDPQQFGALIERPEYVTIHHSLFEGNQSRNPKAKAKIEFINNVIYNWGQSGFVGGHSAEDHYQDLVGNYFIAGPTSTNNFLAMFTATDHVYQKNNYVDLNKDGKLNGDLINDEDFAKETATILKQPSLMNKSSVRISTAEQAYPVVVQQAGSSLKRDAIDERIIGYVKSLGKTGELFKTEEKAGDQKIMAMTKTTIIDSNGDGIPDAWESSRNITSATANKIEKSGYTNLEQYLNGLVKF